MSQIEPGWHPDPSNPSGAVRWWDGSAWTPHTQPSFAPPAATAPGVLAAPAAPPAYIPAQPPPARSFAKRNSHSLTAMAVVVAYLLIAIAAHIVFIGIFPVLLAVRAIRAKEPLAVLSVIAAVVAVGAAIGFLS